MTPNRTSTLIAGWRLRIPARVLTLQLGGNALFALLFIAWLQIPDSHIWQLISSLIAIALIAAGFLVLHVYTLRALREPGAGRRMWASCLLLGAWLLLWWGLVHLVQPHFTEGLVSQRAGYWNSRLSPHLRSTLTYERLSNWQRDVSQLILWWVLPTLLLPLIMESVARAIRTLRERATWRLYKRWQLWLSTAACSWLALWITEKLVAWQPGHSVRAELVSLVLRFAAVYLIDVLIYLVLLAILSNLLAREHTGGYAAAQPTPDSAQPIPPNQF